jgi:uncharacterized membrane protein/mono/diheme cytochrome c family protein
VADVSHWVGVFGRAHPLLVHLPIGFLVALAILEVLAHYQARTLPRPTISVLLWLTAAAAIVTAGSGYALSLEPGYDTPQVLLHMRLGFGVAAGALLVAIVHMRAREGTRTGGMVAYRVLLAITVLLAFPTGHVGGTITHGEGFLTGPLREGWRTEDREVRAAPKSADPPPTTVAPSSPDPKDATASISFARDVAPIFASKCVACHGTSKKKGGLSLADEAAIVAGGRNGPVFVAGDPKTSEMLRRLRLPPDDEDHMPPAAKPQPSREEIDRIEAWIAAGAKFDVAESVPSKSGEPAKAEAPAKEPPKTGAAAIDPAPVETAADPAAIEALRSKLVHVEPVAKGSNLWLVSFSAVARDTGDAEAAALLEPLLPYVADLSLARSRIGDATMQLAARMPNLARLDVRDTAVTDAGVAALEGHPQLADFVLARTKLTDAAVKSLLRLPALKRVYVWNSGIGASALGELRLGKSEIAIEAGDTADARALETEKDLVLTKATAPAASTTNPATNAPPAGGSPAPVNRICPVSGKPIDPAYQVVFKGRVIGFCCPNCPGTFWADPSKYESKLP